VLNASSGPITALLGLWSGALARSPELMRCAELMLQEALAVAHARGIELVLANAVSRLREASRSAAGTKSTILQDLERGRKTEIDALNGRIVALGEELGVPCPMNRLLTSLLKAAESVSRT
jgi:2-dehydropantoate 2-reductase